MSADKMRESFEDWALNRYGVTRHAEHVRDYGVFSCGYQAASAAQAGEIARLTRKLVASNALCEERFEAILTLREPEVDAIATAPVQAQGVPDGWKLVPIELTAEMSRAGYASIAQSDYQCTSLADSYAVLLAAAPLPPGRFDAAGPEDGQ